MQPFFFINQKSEEGFVRINKQHGSLVYSVNTSSVNEKTVSHITWEVGWFVSEMGGKTIAGFFIQAEYMLIL